MKSPNVGFLWVKPLPALPCVHRQSPRKLHPYPRQTSKLAGAAKPKPSNVICASFPK